MPSRLGHRLYELFFQYKNIFLVKTLHVVLRVSVIERLLCVLNSNLLWQSPLAPRGVLPWGSLASRCETETPQWRTPCCYQLQAIAPWTERRCEWAIIGRVGSVGRVAFLFAKIPPLPWVVITPYTQYLRTHNIKPLSQLSLPHVDTFCRECLCQPQCPISSW